MRLKIIPGKNDIVLDLVVDGEQQSNIKKVVHFSPSDSTLERFRLQRLRWWYDPEIKLSKKLTGSIRENGPIIRPKMHGERLGYSSLHFFQDALSFLVSFFLSFPKFIKTSFYGSIHS